MNAGIVYGSYYLLGRLAAGGMAEVFLGKSLSQGGRLLALKRILPQLCEDSNFVSMFVDEARIASSLSHPNICQITDQGKHDNQLYIAMEFIHGKDLRVLKKRAKQRGEPIPFGVVAFVIAKIAEALDYAHAKTNSQGQPENIVHRDVSPQNILLSYDGVPKLIDFGVAKAKHRLVQTRVGVVKGKFAYMSPEQARGVEIDGRTDVFALGVVLYELLTGSLPFKGSSDLSRLKRTVRTEYRPIMQLNADVPPRLAAVVERALKRNADHRYPSAGEMARDLYRHLADERRELSEAVLSSYMRRQFRDDYIREMARIKMYAAFEPPQEARESRAPILGPPGKAALESAQAHKAATPLRDPITATPSQFLAAGYDDGLSDAKPAPGEEPSQRQFNTGEVDNLVGMLDAESAAGPPEQQGAALFADKTTPFTLPPVGEGASADDNLPTDKHPALADKTLPQPVIPSDAPKGAVPTASPPPPSDAPAPVVRAVPPPLPSDSLEAVAPDALRDTHPVEPISPEQISAGQEPTAKQAAIPEPEPPVRPNDDGSDIDIQDSLLSTLQMPAEDFLSFAHQAPAGDPPSSTPAAPADTHSSLPPASAPSRRLLTPLEIAVLFLVAALGLALVLGTYLYATTMEMPPPAPPAAATSP